MQKERHIFNVVTIGIFEIYYELMNEKHCGCNLNVLKCCEVFLLFYSVIN
jgi:hypothetical protein